MSSNVNLFALFSSFKNHTSRSTSWTESASVRLASRANRRAPLPARPVSRVCSSMRIASVQAGLPGRASAPPSVAGLATTRTTRRAPGPTATATGTGTVGAASATAATAGWARPESGGAATRSSTAARARPARRDRAASRSRCRSRSRSPRCSSRTRAMTSRIREVCATTSVRCVRT